MRKIEVEDLIIIGLIGLMIHIVILGLTIRTIDRKASTIQTTVEEPLYETMTIINGEKTVTIKKGN